MEGEDINPRGYVTENRTAYVEYTKTWVIFGGQILHRVSHYFFLIRFKASLDYLDKLPKNLQYGEREIFSTDSLRSSGIPTRYSCCPGNISPISRM